MISDPFVYPGGGLRQIPVDRNLSGQSSLDWVAEEVPVALVYNGISQAVLMTTPSELEELAVGFSLSEGIVKDNSDIYEISASQTCQGVQVDLRISSECFWNLKTRRRSMASRTGCGLCGIEQLGQVRLPTGSLPDTARFALANYAQALGHLTRAEQLGSRTGCTHAAVWVAENAEMLASSEDVGRHVALDKLLGKRALAGGSQGAVLVSSRASFEMVQKAAMCGVQILFAVSAPTALAVEVAAGCGMTLVGFCRPGSFNVYCNPQRLYGEPLFDAAKKPGR